MNSLYPDHPGHKARETAAAAAESIAPTARLLRVRVMEALRAHGAMTADEIADRLDQTPLAVRPRVSELARVASIRDSGRRRHNRSGRRAIVWTIEPEGARP